jgi:hypothetical protein
MKIKKEHYEALEAAIRGKHEEMISTGKDAYQSYLNFGHTNKRIAWDLLNASGMTPFVCNTLYSYLNDTHIDTAVLDIWKKISGRLA